MKAKCRFPGCDRDALPDWTMCATHRSAGDSRKNDRKKKAAA